MPLTPEQTHARAQIAGRRRWHGDAADVTEPEDALDRAALDKHIDELVARAPKMTPEQADRVRRLFRYGPADG
jgi:hypothetical protein